ncbi:MAG: DNA polymerase IV, partial [Acidimicrobiales bacterium]
VEVLDDPRLAGKPVIVGGSGARGVVASCTYEARAFGVHSAMPSVRARQLCPDAAFLDGRHSRYAEVSARLRDVLETFTPLVEPIGLDEAFLDVQGAVRLLGPPGEIGRSIRVRVREELLLDCAVGAGRSKMIAKLASRAAKPRADRGGTRPGPGVVVVAPEEEIAFLHPLDVARLWGVGPVTAKRLHDLGVQTVADLAAVPPQVLVRALGRAQGTHLHSLSRGEDPDPVVAHRPVKSVGHEETFAEDVFDRETLRAHVLRMSESVATLLRGDERAARTITVKVKFPNFSIATRSHTLPLPLDTGGAIAAIADALLDAIELQLGVRLLGVSASGFEPSSAVRQLHFDLEPAQGEGDGAAHTAELAAALAATRQEHWHGVTDAVDAIRERFGTSAVGTASMVGPAGIAVPARRDAPWGPRAPSERDGASSARPPDAGGRG